MSEIKVSIYVTLIGHRQQLLLLSVIKIIRERFLLTLKRTALLILLKTLVVNMMYFVFCVEEENSFSHGATVAEYCEDNREVTIYFIDSFHRGEKGGKLSVR